MYDLFFLVKSLQAAKKSEDAAKQIRIEVEEKIATLVETEEVGQKTVTIEDGTKVTVKRGLNYRADIAEIRKVFADPPFCSLSCPVKTETKYSLDPKGYEWYKENNAAMFGLLSKHVTVTPKKIAVSLREPTS